MKHKQLQHLKHNVVHPWPAAAVPQNLSLKEDKVKLNSKEDKIAIKEEQKCESEQEALEATQGSGPSHTHRR